VKARFGKMRLYLLCLFLSMVLGVLAQDQGPTMSEAEKAGAAAGAAAGATAGKIAGKAAGRMAGMQSIKADVFPKSPPPPLAREALPMQAQEWEKLEKSDPGTVRFFKEFDEDENRRWNQPEYFKGMQALIKRGVIDPKYDVLGNWAKLPKANGELLLRDFLSWAARTKARLLIRNARAGGSASGNISIVQDFKQCRDIFDAFDRRKRGMLKFEEFRQAVTGRIPDDEVKDKFYSLPRTNNMISYQTFSFVCSNVFGLPTSNTPMDAAYDPCEGNPCSKRPGTLCVPDPKKCIVATCPQFKCMKTKFVEMRMPAAVKGYQQCVNLFKSFDKNGDGALIYPEFEAGVKTSVVAGIFPNSFRPFDAWNRFDKDVRGRVTVSEFVHFCVAVTSDADDFGASAREECWDVFTHFDENHSQDLSAREFFKGMRRARRQGHLPQDLNIHHVWQQLPKTKFFTVEVGPFIDFCLLVSKGDDPVVAAHESQPMPQPTLSEEDRALWKGKDIPSPPLRVSTVGVEVRNTAFCDSVFRQANTRKDGKLTRDSFRVVCPTISSETECMNYTQIFSRYDINKDSILVKSEFVAACKSLSVAMHAGNAEITRRAAGKGASSSFVELNSSKSPPSSGADAKDSERREAREADDALHQLSLPTPS